MATTISSNSPPSSPSSPSYLPMPIVALNGRQLSKEKQESETAMVETVRAETAKALEQAQQVKPGSKQETCYLRILSSSRTFLKEYHGIKDGTFPTLGTGWTPWGLKTVSHTAVMQ